jgi:hypothetical protein
MNAKGIVNFFIPFAGTMIAAPRVQNIQITNGLHEVPDEAFKS